MNRLSWAAQFFCILGTLFFVGNLNAADGNLPATSVVGNRLSSGDQERYEEAIKLMNHSEYAIAYEMLVDLASRNPKSGYPFAGLAELKYWLVINGGDGTYSDAYTLAQRALQLDPNLADAYAVIAKVMIEQKNISAARDAADKAIAIDPDDPLAIFAKARVADVANEYEEAERWYRRAIDIHKDNARKSNIYRWLAWMLRDKTPPDITKATEAYIRAADLGGNGAILNDTATFLFSNTDRYDQAIDYLERAIKIMGPRSDRTLLGLAEYYKWGDSFQNPKKYKDAKRKPLDPAGITERTGVTPEYAFVRNANVTNFPATTFALLDSGLISNIDVVPVGLGNTALGYAAYQKHWDLAAVLIKKGANVNAGKPPAIFFAVFQGNNEVVKFLVENGARVNSVDANGRPLTSYALNQKVGKPASILDYLLEHGADPDIPDNNGLTLIASAVARNDVDAVRLLINKYHANANAKYYSTSILGVAATAPGWNGKEIVKILLAAGANPWIRDSDADLVTKMMLYRADAGYASQFPAEKDNAAMLIEARKHIPKPADFGQEYQGK